MVISCSPSTSISPTLIKQTIAQLCLVPVRQSPSQCKTAILPFLPACAKKKFPRPLSACLAQLDYKHSASSALWSLFKLEKYYSPSCSGGTISRLHSFTPSLLHSFIPALLHSFASALLRSFAPSLLRSFAPLLLRSFAPSLLHSFTRSRAHL